MDISNSQDNNFPQHSNTIENIPGNRRNNEGSTIGSKTLIIVSGGILVVVVVVLLLVFLVGRKDGNTNIANDNRYINTEEDYGKRVEEDYGSRIEEDDNTNTEKKVNSFEVVPINCSPQDENQWYRTDSTFVVDPKNPSIMYVNVEYKGFYKTTDNGNTWNLKTKGIVTDHKDSTTGKPCYTEYPVAVIDPVNSSRLLLATSGGGGGTINDPNMHGGGVYETTDGGESWHQKINETMNGYVTHALVLDPLNSNTWYYGTAASPASYREADPNKIWVTKGIIYKTSDNGNNWEELPTGVVKDTRLTHIVVNPNNTQQIVASTVHMLHMQSGPNKIGDQNMGIIESLDGGSTWKRIDNLPKQYEASYDFASSKTNFNKMFHIPATNDGVKGKSFYSVDGGHNWLASSSNMDMVKYNPNIVDGSEIVGYKWQCTDGPCVNSLYKSTDSGATWKPFGTLPVEIKNLQDHKTRIQNIVWHPTDKNTFLMTGASGFVWKTVDNGKTWIKLLDYMQI